jgi:hypothetical protein
MDPSQTALPARERHIRRRGLLPCCFESVNLSQRLTVPMSQLQCRDCQAILQVDLAGAWTWLKPPVSVVEPAPTRSVARMGARSS